MLCASAIRPDAIGGQARSRREALAIIGAESLIKPAFSFRMFDVREVRGDVLDLGEAQIRVPAIAALPGTLEGVAAAACTIGAALEQRVSRLFAEHQPLLALALDAIGTEKLFALAERAAIRIRREARSRGLQTGPEANPGDAGFPIDQQGLVLSLAGAAEGGVTTGGAGMLVPVKSLSFLLPTGRDLPAPSLFRRCERCSSKDRCTNKAN